MKSKRMCSGTLKILVDKRFQSNKISGDLFFEKAIVSFFIGLICPIIVFNFVDDPLWKMSSTIFPFIFAIAYVPLTDMFPILVSIFQKHKIFYEINKIQYHDELSKIFDFNCEYTRQVVLEDRFNDIKDKIANDGYLDGEWINGLVDLIICLKRATERDKKMEEEKLIAEQNKIEKRNLNMNTNAFLELKKIGHK